MFCVVAVNPPGPAQLKVAFVALVVVVTTTEVVVQVSGPLGVVLTLGGVLFCTTVATALAVQPVPGEVTVTV